MLRNNSFEEGSSELHRVEKNTNCCGWKHLELKGCGATNITESIKTCYDEIGYPMQHTFLRMLIFYITYTVYAIAMMVILLRSKSSKTPVTTGAAEPEKTAEEEPKPKED